MARMLRLSIGACLTAALLMPLSSAIAQAPTSLHEMTRIADNVFSFRFFIHRNLVVVTDDGVVVTDPISPVAARHMADAIREMTERPVKYVIYSHNHWDHISGAKVFKDAGAKIVQHELAARNTKPNPNVVPADETFAGDKHVLTVGGQALELIYLGPSHGSGMIAVRLPKQRILHVVDVVTPGRIAFRSMPDFVPQDWIKALGRIEALDFDRIVPGHGPPSVPKSAATEIREYVEDLTKAVAVATEVAGSTYAIEKITDLVKAELRPKYGTWAEFDNWMQLNVERIVMEQRYGW